MEKFSIKFDDNNRNDENLTAVKCSFTVQSDLNTTLKDLDNYDAVESQQKSLEQKLQVKTPEKAEGSEANQKRDLVNKDDGMISTVEQARLLIAACKTPSKTVNKTPVKHNSLNGKRSIESSPITPGKQRRVELVTLSSPKTKRFKLGQCSDLNWTADI